MRLSKRMCVRVVFRFFDSLKMNTVQTKLYLFTFHLSLCIGWTYILIGSLSYISEQPNYILFEERIHKSLQIVQLIDSMEILHIVYKLVKCNIFLTTIDVLNRVFIVWFIFYYRDIYQFTTGDIYSKKILYGSDFEVGILGYCLSSSSIQLTRHLYLALDIYGLSPYLFIQLRYSVFTILYPTAICSQLYSIWLMRQNVNPLFWSISMPNKLNFQFNYKAFITFALCLYAIYAPFKYKTIIQQRNNIFNQLNNINTQKKNE